MRTPGYSTPLSRPSPCREVAAPDPALCPRRGRARRRCCSGRAGPQCAPAAGGEKSEKRREPRGGANSANASDRLRLHRVFFFFFMTQWGSPSFSPFPPPLPPPLCFCDMGPVVRGSYSCGANVFSITERGCVVDAAVFHCWSISLSDRELRGLREVLVREGEWNVWTRC